MQHAVCLRCHVWRHHKSPRQSAWHPRSENTLAQGTQGVPAKGQHTPWAPTLLSRNIRQWMALPHQPSTHFKTQCMIAAGDLLILEASEHEGPLASQASAAFSPWESCKLLHAPSNRMHKHQTKGNGHTECPESMICEPSCQTHSLGLAEGQGGSNTPRG